MTYKVGSTSEITSPTSLQVTDEIQYLDGLGRPVQSIVKSGSPLGRDIIQPMAYDAYGRVAREYEPYSLASNNGAYSASALTQQASFYTGTSKVAPTQYPFKDNVYENSPQDRVLVQSAPGENWRLDPLNNQTYLHNVKNQILFNTLPDAIKRLSVDGSGNLVVGSGSNEFYAANLLTGSIIEDEHGQKTKEYKDGLGNVVMKESGIIGTTAVRTYYVYDDFNNLRFVLPPQSFPSQSGYAGNTQLWLADHAYQYKYDERQRMIYKKLPGADAIYYVYDPMNRPILEQDGNLRAQSTATAQKWKYMKYDAFGRVIETGISTLNPTVIPTASAHRVPADVRISSPYFTLANYFTNFTNFYEERCAYLYTTYTFPPVSSSEVYTSNFYDDYNFDCNTMIVPIVGPAYLNWLTTIYNKFSSNKGTGYTELTDQTLNLRVRGLQTASDIKVLDASVTDATAQYNMYDTKSRPIQTIEEQGSGNIKVVNSAYNFEGKPITVQSFYTEGITGQTHRITERYEYDALGRLVKQYLKPGADAEKLVASLGYNEVGQLTEKSLHNTTGTSHLQNLDYRYNVRGWLKSINNGWLNSDYGYLNAIYSPTTYANTKLAQLQSINTLYATDPVAATTQLNAITTELKNNYFTTLITVSNGGAVNCSKYVLESMDAMGTSDHSSYSTLYPYYVQAFTNIVNGVYVNDDSNDLFGEELEYENGNGELNAAAQYNGNISSVRWKTKNTTNNAEYKAYGFTYDALNRLTDSKYAVFNIPATLVSYNANTSFRWNLKVDNYSENGIQYDLNGNIKALQRKGQTGGTALAPTYTFNAGVMDNLTYLYDKGGNQLKVVNDAATALPTGLTLEFKDGFAGSIASPDYFYDANGNLTQDKNKSISSITYNILNLPQLITFSNGNKIEFVYDATGQKLKKTVKNSSNVITSVKYYLGAAEFTGTTPVLEAIYFSEGRLTKSGTNPYQYEYTIKDHLGNARISFKANGSTVNVSTDLLQENNYYPFGLQHSPTFQVGVANKYQYNGKEFNDELGLNVFDYGARMYDATKGRWDVVDPLSAKYPHESPYIFVGNNPIIYIDPDGREKIIALDKNKKSDQNIIAGAEKYGDDGAIHIFGHGNTKGMYLVMDGKKVNIESPEQLNNFLNKNSETWQNKGDDKPMIVLHSCNTGRDQKDGSASFAEKVSESKLFKDVTIVAPNERDYFNANGEVGTYKAKYADENGTYKTKENGEIKSKERSDTPGSWRIFKNGEQTEQYRGDWKPKEQPTLMDNFTKKQE